MTEESVGSLPLDIILKKAPIRPCYIPCGQFRTPATEHPGLCSRACMGPTINIVHWYPSWFPITASVYSDVDVCVMGHYYTYLDIWKGRVIKIIINIKNSNIWFIHVQSILSVLCFHCMLVMSVLMIQLLMHVFWFRFIGTRVLIYARHLALIWPLIGEFSNFPGLACSDTEVWIEVEPSVEDQASRSRLISPSSFCS